MYVAYARIRYFSPRCRHFLLYHPSDWLVLEELHVFVEPLGSKQRDIMSSQVVLQKRESCRLESKYSGDADGEFLH